MSVTDRDIEAHILENALHFGGKHNLHHHRASSEVKHVLVFVYQLI